MTLILWNRISNFQTGLSNINFPYFISDSILKKKIIKPIKALKNMREIILNFFMILLRKFVDK